MLATLHLCFICSNLICFVLFNQNRSSPYSLELWDLLLYILLLCFHFREWIIFLLLHIYFCDFTVTNWWRCGISIRDNRAPHWSSPVPITTLSTDYIRVSPFFFLVLLGHLHAKTENYSMFHPPCYHALRHKQTPDYAED